MTPEQIRLVQESFRLVVPIGEQAAVLFYSRLFQIDPGTEALFAGADMKAQGRKLMAAIAFVVHALDRSQTMIEQVRALGRRHVGYGVEERHYETVGAALLWALAAGLGDAFTPAMRDAWAAAYKLLSTTMIEASRQGGFEKAA
jgi:hemoglobin-like flavoprotein